MAWMPGASGWPADTAAVQASDSQPDSKTRGNSFFIIINPSGAGYALFFFASGKFRMHEPFLRPGKRRRLHVPADRNRFVSGPGDTGSFRGKRFGGEDGRFPKYGRLPTVRGAPYRRSVAGSASSERIYGIFAEKP